MRKIAGLLIVLTAVSWSCSKDETAFSENYTDQVRFFVSAEVDGRKTDLRAGQEGYEMLTSFRVNNRNVLEMEGLLASADASESFRLIFHSEEHVTESLETEIPETFREGYLPLADESETVTLPFTYHLKAWSNIDLSSQNHRWISSTGTDQSDTLSLADQHQFPGSLYQLKLDLTNGQRCVKSLTHQVELNHDCRAQMHIRKAGNNMLFAEIRATAGKIHHVTWLDEGPNNPTGISHSRSFHSATTDTVRAEISFEDGCTQRIEKVFDPGSVNLDDCDVHLAWNTDQATEERKDHLGTVEMRYTTANGEEYTSFYQNNEGWLRLAGTSDFQANENGQSTRRFNFQGEAVLRNDRGAEITLKNLHGSYVVGHP